MDLGNIVYVVAVLGYFIYRAVQGKKEKELADTNQPEQEQAEKPVSFEDLLKEIREAQKPKRQAPEPKPVFQEVVVPQEKLRAKPIAVRRSQAVEVLDDEARFYQGAYNSSNQNATKITDVTYEGSFLKVEQYEASKKVNRYAAVLKNQQTLREALIVSEILKPRHF